jgi:hypothetical protein
MEILKNGESDIEIIISKKSDLNRINIEDIHYKNNHKFKNWNEDHEDLEDKK